MHAGRAGRAEDTDLSQAAQPGEGEASRKGEGLSESQTEEGKTRLFFKGWGPDLLGPTKGQLRVSDSLREGEDTGELPDQ